MLERVQSWAVTKQWIEMRRIFNLPAFFHLGNFLVALDGNDLVLRLTDEDAQQALQIEGARRWRMGPQAHKVYTLLPATALADDEALHGWLEKAYAATEKLPPKDRLLTKTPTPPEWKKTPAEADTEPVASSSG